MHPMSPRGLEPGGPLSALAVQEVSWQLVLAMRRNDSRHQLEWGLPVPDN